MLKDLFPERAVVPRLRIVSRGNHKSILSGMGIPVLADGTEVRIAGFGVALRGTCNPSTWNDQYSWRRNAGIIIPASRSRIDRGTP
jgi:hypothetical protein